MPTNPTGVDTATAVGAKCGINDMVTVSAGYEDDKFGGGDVDTQYVLGADATFGAIVVRARYADPNFGTQQTAFSATNTMDALSVTGFYMDNTQDGHEAWGLAASHDLGVSFTFWSFGGATWGNSGPWPAIFHLRLRLRGTSDTTGKEFLPGV